MKINCYLWQKQNRPIIIINLVSLERQPVSNLVDKGTILKQVGAILKEDANTVFEETSSVFWPPSILKILENPQDDSDLLFICYIQWIFISKWCI